jgi:uncharacterized protein YndB with AHSA1/START domain
MSEPKDEELVFEADLDAPPEKVWRALAVPGLRAAWLGEVAEAASQVIETREGERLVLNWPSGPIDTEIAFEIAPSEGGGTHLRIVHAVRAEISNVIAFPATRRSVMTAASATAPKWAA